MAVYKRYKGKRINRSDPNWEGANWWMEFKLRGHHIHESIPGARTQAQAERAENSIREEIYTGKYDRTAKTKGFSDFVETVFVPWAKANKLTWRHDECRAERLKQFFRRSPLREINPMMVRRLKNELLTEKTRRVDIVGERTQRKGSLSTATFNCSRRYLNSPSRRATLIPTRCAGCRLSPRARGASVT